MQIETVFAIGALLLRLGMLGAGVIFCWFGFRLFSKSHSPGDAQFAVKDYLKLNLSQVGPGVFFSLFGAAILIYSIHNSPSLNLKEVTPDKDYAVDVKGAGSTPATSTDRGTRLQASNQIAFINRIDTESGSIATQDLGDIARMSRQIRLSIMRSVWNKDEWDDPADFAAWVRDPSEKKPNVAAQKFFERK
jgi:hypothetical protein